MGNLVLLKLLTKTPAWLEKFSVFSRLTPDCFDFYLCFLDLDLASFLLPYYIGLNGFLISDYKMVSNVQFVNDFHGLISPVPKGTPLLLVLLGKVPKIC